MSISSANSLQLAHRTKRLPTLTTAQSSLSKPGAAQVVSAKESAPVEVGDVLGRSILQNDG